MQQPDSLLTDNERQTLRDGIKTKYYQYHLSNPARFPKFEYNTSRSNYEPLRSAFEEEFYVVRNLNRTSPTIHIPSTNTLAMLFTDNSYVPGRKILNTCRSYAEGPAILTETTEQELPKQASLPTSEKIRNLLAGGFVLLVFTGLIVLLSRWFFAPQPSGLVIERPTVRSTVQQEVIVEGKAANAEIVWLVVHPKSGDFYYVQPAAKVQDNNWWISVIFIGSVLETDEGHHFQIRAFVNPTTTLHSGQMLRAWPKAELATNALEIVRGKNRPN